VFLLDCGVLRTHNKHNNTQQQTNKSKTHNSILKTTQNKTTKTQDKTNQRTSHHLYPHPYVLVAREPIAALLVTRQLEERYPYS
jgi:hypothetical protein